MDNIVGLEIPDSVKSVAATKSDLSLLKDDIRKKLNHINHKYLVLIDLGFDGTADRDYELQTADLLTSELAFKRGGQGSVTQESLMYVFTTIRMVLLLITKRMVKAILCL